VASVAGLPDRHCGWPPPAEVIVKSDKEIQFRININDLALLRALGIDPTRKVRTTRRIEPISTPSDEQ
jgi:hypothetical protein